MLKIVIERIRLWVNSLDLTWEEKKRIGYVMLGSTILAVLLLVVDNLPLNTTLLRNTYGGGTHSQELLVSIGNLWNKEPITISLGEKIYTQEELEIAREEAWEKAIALIKEEHPDLDAVSGILDLPEKVAGYPFQIDWQWSPIGALSRDGVINETYLGEMGLVLELIATIEYEDSIQSFVQSVRLIEGTKTQEEEAMIALLEEIKTNESERTEEKYTLPSKVGEWSISWKQKFESRGLLVWILGVVIAVLLLWKKKQDTALIEENIREEMEGDYPEIIGTFVLYLGAGMTSKRAWQKMVEHYDLSPKARPAYEEMKKTYIEMLNGGGEITAYENFAYRVEIPCYKKFGLLLAQNVKKGTKGMTQILENEAKEAFEIRKRRAKSLGEAAGTKLLMPMFLMLAVVLVVIVIPSFFSIQL